MIVLRCLLFFAQSGVIETALFCTMQCALAHAAWDGNLTELKNLDLVWKFTSSDDVVLLENTCQTLFSIMEKQKGVAPARDGCAAIPQVEGRPHGTGDFQVEMEHEVAWRAERATVAAPGSKQNFKTLQPWPLFFQATVGIQLFALSFGTLGEARFDWHQASSAPEAALGDPSRTWVEADIGDL